MAAATVLVPAPTMRTCARWGVRVRTRMPFCDANLETTATTCAQATPWNVLPQAHLAPTTDRVRHHHRINIWPGE
eukprot:3603533-Pyramimonas_sp.AAC.1